MQMGDGNELDVQSAAAFAKPGEVLSYWQLQVSRKIHGAAILDSGVCREGSSASVPVPVLAWLREKPLMQHC